MDKDQAAQLDALAQALDAALDPYLSEFAPHSLAGILLSRVVLLMASDPPTGKGLVRYVWQQLDQIEQDNPGNIL